MWTESPEQRLALVLQRQAQLRAEAAANRLTPRIERDHSFSGLRVRVGSLIIVIGRTLADDVPVPHAVRF